MDEKLALDYKATRQYFYHLAETRFKLLAFVPTITGAAVTLLAANHDAPLMLGVGIFGWLVTLGIIFYDQRNTQIYDTMVLRAKSLEILVGFDNLTSHLCPERASWQQGGAFLDRPPRSLRLVGTGCESSKSVLEDCGWIPMWHDGGLALIYSAAMAAWTWLLVHGATAMTHGSSETQPILWLAWVIGGVIGVLFFLRLYAIDRRRSRGQTLPEALAEHVRDNFTS